MRAVSWLTAGLAAAAWGWAGAQDAPRTAWGDPDLQGTYTSDNSIGVPFERPAQFGNRLFLTEEEFKANMERDRYQRGSRKPQ